MRVLQLPLQLPALFLGQGQLRHPKTPNANSDLIVPQPFQCVTLLLAACLVGVLVVPSAARAQSWETVWEFDSANVDLYADNYFFVAWKDGWDRSGSGPNWTYTFSGSSRVSAGKFRFIPPKYRFHYAFANGVGHDMVFLAGDSDQVWFDTTTSKFVARQDTTSADAHSLFTMRNHAHPGLVGSERFIVGDDYSYRFDVRVSKGSADFGDNWVLLHELYQVNGARPAAGIYIIDNDDLAVGNDPGPPYWRVISRWGKSSTIDEERVEGVDIAKKYVAPFEFDTDYRVYLHFEPHKTNGSFIVHIEKNPDTSPELVGSFSHWTGTIYSHDLLDQEIQPGAPDETVRASFGVYRGGIGGSLPDFFEGRFDKIRIDHYAN